MEHLSHADSAEPDSAELLQLSNSTANGTHWCDAEEVKKESRKLAILFSFECVLATASFSANFFFLIIIRKVRVMPVNVRCLLAHLSFTLSWYAAATMFKAITFLSVSDPCSLRMNALECRLQELLVSLPGSGMFYSLFGICVERLVSTFYGRNRDHTPTPPIMAVLFILIVWTATLFNNFFSLLYVSRNRTVAVCEVSLSVEPYGATVAVAVNLALEISAMGVMAAVSTYENYVAKNLAINRVLYTLSSRFYITQNVQVNALMLPSMLLHMVCYLPNMIFYVLVVYNTPMSVTTRWTLIHLSRLWILFYALCHPILAFARNFHVKKQFKKTKFWILLQAVWKKSTGKVAAAYNDHLAAEDNLRAHFEYLERVWSVTYQRQRAHP